MVTLATVAVMAAEAVATSRQSLGPHDFTPGNASSGLIPEKSTRRLPTVYSAATRLSGAVSSAPYVAS